MRKLMLVVLLSVPVFGCAASNETMRRPDLVVKTAQGDVAVHRGAEVDTVDASNLDPEKAAALINELSKPQPGKGTVSDDCNECPRRPRMSIWGRLSTSAGKTARFINAHTEVSPSGHVSTDMHYHRGVDDHAIRPFGKRAKIVFLNRENRDEESTDFVSLNEGQSKAEFALEVSGPFSHAEVRRRSDNALVVKTIKAPSYKFPISNYYNNVSEEYWVNVYWQGDPNPDPLPLTVQSSGRKSTVRRH